MATAGQKGIPCGGCHENRQNIVPVCGQVRAGAPALLYVRLRRLHRRCAHLCNTGMGTSNRPFFKKEHPNTRNTHYHGKRLLQFFLLGASSDLAVLGSSRQRRHLKAKKNCDCASFAVHIGLFVL